jgi:hypothetical protein
VIKIQHIISQIHHLKEKYFGEAKGILDSIKDIFNSKPLEPVLYEFYQRETAKIDSRKNSR